MPIDHAEVIPLVVPLSPTFFGGTYVEQRYVAGRRGDRVAPHCSPCLKPSGTDCAPRRAPARDASTRLDALYPEYFSVKRDPVGAFLPTNAPILQQGWIDLPERPGFGIEVDEAFVKRYRVDS